MYVCMCVCIYKYIIYIHIYIYIYIQGPRGTAPTRSSAGARISCAAEIQHILSCNML